jgi:carbonic anhydrase/acetyltransferase-like protein (isoleucine patch superfamily)
MKVPPLSFLMGSPATVRREITEADRELIRRSALNYIALKNDYMKVGA